MAAKNENQNLIKNENDIKNRDSYLMIIIEAKLFSKFK